MLVTEEEAKQLWCPHARPVSNDSPSSGNRWVGDVFDQRAAEEGDNARPLNTCIGAACMAWRWSAPPFDKTLRSASKTVRGYCGLAGLATYTGSK